MSTPTINPRKKRGRESELQYRETHIASEDNWDIALCGRKRDRPWYVGYPAKQATCAICLDMWNLGVGSEA